MAATVARQESYPLAFKKARDDGFGRIAEGRFDTDFPAAGEAFHRIEAASSDDADACLRLLDHTVRLRFQSDGSLSCWKLRTGVHYGLLKYFSISSASGEKAGFA
jgi:hypothetical protein